MKYIVASAKFVCRAAADVEASAVDHKFGVLGIRNLQTTMTTKGVDFPKACRIPEVCNPVQASRVLGSDTSLNMLLPCRISVFEDGGETKICTTHPSALLSAFSDSEDLQSVAQEVETTIRQIIDDAA